MSDRAFRSDESYEAEETTRRMILDFLRSRGFRELRDVLKPIGAAKSQTVHATAPNGERLAMRVKLCWRRTNSKNSRSATQLLAKIRNGEWEGSIQRFVEHAARESVTHFLFIKREDLEITAAALMPISDLVAIWSAQRKISDILIANGKTGRRKKNQTMNGSSPTLWLEEDEEARQITDVLWDHPRVQDLVELKIVDSMTKEHQSLDDTFNDNPGLDFSQLGSDGAPRTVTAMSHVSRDQRVRAAVLERAGGKCEREGCTNQGYLGFFDVHHILGVEKSDRVWNCVAVCPNCHRDAHAAPDRDQINAALMVVATRYRTAGN